MNLYRISQNKNNDYNTYDSAVVAAPSEDVARQIHPDNTLLPADPPESAYIYDWCHPKYVTVKLIGTAVEGTEEGVIIASFNAG